MPGDRDGPDAGGDETLPRNRLILLFAGFCLAATGCDGSPPPPVAATFTVAARAEKPIETYGAIVPMIFTVTSESDFPVRLLRVEVTAGTRREIWVAPPGAPPLPGRGTFELPAVAYRVIEQREQILISYEAADPADPTRGHGRERLARATLDIPCPALPFDPNFWNRKFEAWTFSISLGGFVFRVTPNFFLLATKERDIPLPPLVFELLRDLDLAPDDSIAVLMPNERPRTVTAATLRAFLDEVQKSGHRLLFSSRPDLARYEVKE